jgi:septum formation initiator
MAMNDSLWEAGGRLAPAKGAPMASASHAARRRVARGGVRWDRIGRVGLLLVLGLILLLYIGPARSFYSTWQESHAKRDEVRRLTAEHTRLDARRRALGDPRTLEAEARKLGMVRPTERAFVVKGLPQH